MSETPSSAGPSGVSAEATTGPVVTAGPAPAALPPVPPAALPPVPAAPPVQQSNKLYKAAAWVVIVAGVVFIAGSIFFTGFFLGRHSGAPGPYGRHAPSVEIQRMPMGPQGGPLQGGPFMMPRGQMGPGPGPVFGGTEGQQTLPTRP